MFEGNRGTQVRPSRRNAVMGGAGILASAGFAATAAGCGSAQGSGMQRRMQGKQNSNAITMADGTQIYYKDWGAGQPVVCSHGWPSSSDAWADQLMFWPPTGFAVSPMTGVAMAGRSSRGTAATWIPKQTIWQRLSMRST